MAKVYLAALESEGGFLQRVVVKRLKQGIADAAFSKMLSDEARLLTRLRHSNVVGVFELASDEIGPYFVMEFVDGVDLGKLFYKVRESGKIMPLKFSLYIVARALEALSYAHLLRDDEGRLLDIVHRDINPPNILLSYAGAVKLADFGIARGKHRDAHTTTGHLKGKYSYMSPEQVRGEVIDRRSDIFAMGIILFELLTGQRLFDGENDFEILKRVESCSVPVQKLSGLDPELKHIILRALQRDTGARYHDALSFLEDVEDYSRKKGLTVFSHQLGEFIRGLFPVQAVASAANAGRTVVMEAEKRRSLWKYAVAVVGICAIAASLYFFRFHKQSIETAAVVQPQIPVEIPAQVKPSLPAPEEKIKPASFGKIVIDAKPEGAVCDLTLNGKLAQHTLPLVIEKVDISSPVNGSFVITKDGFSAKKGSFELTPSKAVFSRVFQLAPKSNGTIVVNASPWGYVSIPGVAKGRETPFGPTELEAGDYSITVSYPPDNKSTTQQIKIAAGQEVRCMAQFGASASLRCF